MRPLLITVATCLAFTRVPAQSARSTPIAPPPDSITAMPVTRIARPSASEKSVSIRERFSNGPTPRFITYVVDRQFVLLADQSAADSANRNPLGDLPVADIEGIYALKEKSLPASWRTCPGVPVMLILTTSKHWRPRVAETRAPNKRCPVAAP